MGLKKSFNYDHIGKLLAQLEGEDYR